MSIISINHTNQDYTQFNDHLNDLVDLGVGTGITMLMPALWYCSSIGRIWPLQLLACELVLGTSIGWLIYWMRSSDYVTVIDLKPTRAISIAAYRRRRSLALPR